MIDIGANLSNKQFDHDLNLVLEKSFQKDLKHIILTTTDEKTFKKNLSILDIFSHLSLSTTWGLHPHYAEQLNSFIKTKPLNFEKISCLGEFGLDYFRMISTKDQQIQAMQYFLSVAQNNPLLGLFLHERKAHNDFLAQLKSINISNKKVVHCFTGSPLEAKNYLDLDCYIGLTGWITDKRRNQEALEALKYIPIDKIMIETDCPYLTPQNMNKKVQRCEPSFLIHVAQKISDVKNISLNDVISTTTENAISFFNLNQYNNTKKVKL